jgi:hypothetical protein
MVKHTFSRRDLPLAGLIGASASMVQAPTWRIAEHLTKNRNGIATRKG